MNWLDDELSELDRRSMLRRLRTAEKIDGARLRLDGRELINFASNNYLGLARDPQVLEGAREAVSRWGAGATASRLLAGTSRLHVDFERALADFLKCDAALVFPTGFMANLGVMTALAGPGDAIVMDRLSHASLIDAVRLSGARLLVYPHADVAGAEHALQRAQEYRRRFLVTESLYSMDGDIAPLRELAELARRYDAVSYLDEAHALGVWGYQGRGVLGLEGMDDRWDIVVGTLSKAFGSQGGFVAGSSALIQMVVNKARPFLFTTGIAPACVGAAAAALQIIQSDPSSRVRVQQLSNLLRDGLRLQEWDILNSTTQIVPILLRTPEEAVSCADFLQQRGFFAPAIRPPTVPDGSCRLRFSVTADHDESDIGRLLEALSHFPLSSRGAGEGGGEEEKVMKTSMLRERRIDE